MIRPAETFWRLTHGPAWIHTYAASTFAPTRAAIGAALKRVAPFASALDLGCHCGVLVPWLEAASPTVALTGVDVSREALVDADAHYPQHTWIVGSVVDWLPAQAGAKHWDVVTSSSCLEHIAPQDIDATLTALAAVAAHAIVLQEVTLSTRLPTEGPSNAGVLEWRYDYPTRLAHCGWTCVAKTMQDSDPTRPGAVMTFLKG